MFDIGWSELLIIGVIALIAIGPKELPGVLRMVGQWMGKVRRMASEFQGQFQEAMREAEREADFENLKKHVDSMTEGLDPMESVRREVEAATAIEDTPVASSGAAASPAAETLQVPETSASAADEAPVAPSGPVAPEPTVADAEAKEAGGRAA
jgi:sec-independent protein translocase protein TatB